MGRLSSCQATRRIQEVIFCLFVCFFPFEIFVFKVVIFNILSPITTQ